MLGSDGTRAAFGDKWADVAAVLLQAHRLPVIAQHLGVTLLDRDDVPLAVERVYQLIEAAVHAVTADGANLAMKRSMSPLCRGQTPEMLSSMTSPAWYVVKPSLTMA